MITIVSGLPRSGTSLMMQMLEKGGMEILTDNIRKPDENNIHGYYEYEKVKSLQKAKSWLKEAENKAVKVIAQLLYFLPRNHEYAVIFMERNMEEIIRSQTKMLKNIGQTGANLDPNILAQTFQKQVNQVKHFLSNQNNIRVLFISYNEILKSPMKGIEEVNGFLGNLLLKDKMVYAVDITLYREKI